jgi:lipopolysaccharide assembly LptE-like protein
MTRVAYALTALALLVACGYHVTGRGDLLPKSVKTIAIPAFHNATTRQTLARMLAEDVTREFNSRTRYRIVDDPKQADAVLYGTLSNFDVNPIIFDPATFRATTVHVRATVQLTLTDRATGKPILSRPNLQWDERYQVSENPQAYFDESGTAIIRVSQAMARSIVSTILENF